MRVGVGLKAGVRVEFTILVCIPFMDFVGVFVDLFKKIELTVVIIATKRK